LSAHATKTGYGKAGKQKPLSNFPTATTTTKYIQLWDTDSKGKVSTAAIVALGLELKKDKESDT